MKASLRSSPPRACRSVGEGFEHLPQRAAIDRGLKAAMTRLIGRIPVGEIQPGRTGAQDPENPIQDVARIAPRPSAAIATQTWFRQERRQHGPLRVGQVHTAEYDRSIIISFTDPVLGFMR